MYPHVGHGSLIELTAHAMALIWPFAAKTPPVSLLMLCPSICVLVQDEMLAHRLGLIPLQADAALFTEKAGGWLQLPAVQALAGFGPVASCRLRAHAARIRVQDVAARHAMPCLHTLCCWLTSQG